MDVRLKTVGFAVFTMLVSLHFLGCISFIDTNGPQRVDQTDTAHHTVQSISIACWNLQVFGQSKASNDTLVQYYADKLDDYDVFIIQELRDTTGEVIEAFAQKVPEYQYLISNRAGKSTSKEQYAVFYNRNVTLVSSHDYQAEYQTVMQRPPLKVSFTSNNWTFTAYTVHLQPTNVPKELSALETIIGNGMGDTIILGDLNADGSYYDEDHIQHFTDWNWVVTNEIDTTVAVSNNTYDRILLNKAAMNNFLACGVMDDVSSEESDHYLVYAIFNTLEA